MTRIEPNRMDRSFFLFQEELEVKALEVLRSSWYILGREVKSFEEEFAEYNRAKYCVGLANGLDALYLAFRVLNIGQGDEVIVPANTYIASVMGITMANATPVFVEPDAYLNIDADKIEEKITEQTKAILVVHLYGQACRMDKVMELANRYNLRVVEDCAQSHGACFDDQITGTFGDIGCFSFYPTKNLGAYGDAGAIVTNDIEIDRAYRVMRNYGSEKRYYNEVVGVNSRLDEIQAGLLRVKLLHLDALNGEKGSIARRYNEELNSSYIQLPQIRKGAKSVWHQYVIRTSHREAFTQYLDERGIGTIIHYPIPPHLSKAYRYLGYKEGDFPITELYANEVLSLPMYNGMTEDEQSYIIEAINAFAI